MQVLLWGSIKVLLNATLWAVVDDDYYATIAPPQNVWTASDSHHTEDKPEIFEAEVGEIISRFEKKGFHLKVRRRPSFFAESNEVLTRELAYPVVDCSSNEDSRLIVYELMQNGSLETQLHGYFCGALSNAVKTMENGEKMDLVRRASKLMVMKHRIWMRAVFTMVSTRLLLSMALLVLSTVGDKVLGPLDEKDATLGDIHFPITVFGKLILAVEQFPFSRLPLMLVIATKMRASGDPYLQHCLKTVVLLAFIGADSTVVVGDNCDHTGP
ncbi:hypothetical protein P8452_03911 [Trifolium repens]|nr:hypothetical protein P8452_03911 [Trifolium repens]